MLTGREFLGLSEKEPVYAVLEDDGTEVDEEVNIYSMYIFYIYNYFNISGVFPTSPGISDSDDFNR